MMKLANTTLALVLGLATVAGAAPATLATFDLTTATMGIDVANADAGLINWYEIHHGGGNLTVSTIDVLTSLPDTEIGLYDVDGVFLGASDGALGSLTELTMDLVEGVYYAAAGGFDLTFAELFEVESIDTDTGNIAFTASVPPEAPGDFDGDDIVGMEDLNLVLNNWGAHAADGIPDGWVDDLPISMIGADELHKVLSEWDNTFTANSTPEPSSLVLVLLGFAALARRLR